MLIFTCIVILKHRWWKYRWLSAILVVMILLLLIFWIKKIYKYIDNRNNIISTQEWVNTLDFSNTLEITKTWKLESYPEVTILSDINGEILSINVVTWDIVNEYDILMQIKDIDWISSDYDDVDEMINVMNENYLDLEKEYKEFQLEYWDKIKNLEKQLYNNQNALVQAMELNDKEWMEILEKEINDVSLELKTLKLQKENLENWVTDLKSQIQLVRNESDKYYYKQEKQTPRAPFKWIIWNIYVWEWESVKNWDLLLSVINNNYTPEISVSLDFNEYILTKNLTWVSIINENKYWWDYEYKWEIYTRSPILNDEWKYTVTIKTDNWIDLILSDDNSKISVIFTIYSTWEWIPDNCFKKIWNNKWVLTLRDWNIIIDKEVSIKSKWNWWNNIELKLYSLENEEEKDGIQLCVEDWNKWIIKENDIDIVNWFNEFDSVEDFCEEFIKINTGYWENRNKAIVSELWWTWEVVEVLCRIDD